MNKLLKNISYRRYLESLTIIILDIGFFTKTNANKAPAIVLMLGFVLVYLSIYMLVYVVLSFLKLYAVPIKRKRRLTWYITSVISLFIALESIGELSAKDIIVVLPLAVLAYLYINYAASAKTNEKKIS